MKWAVVILITLGLLAALSASLLVNTLRSSDSTSASRSSNADADVLVAAKSLPAMSVLTASLVVRGTAPQNELPENYLTNPIQAIGRVLAVPIVEGQILTESCFVTQGTGAQLAASLPEGMRAVSVTLASSVITGGLLYPGCIVDVLVTFRLPSGEGAEAISTTLLREVQVLAVEGSTVVSREKDPEDKKKGSLGLAPARNTYGRVMVTLMVDPRQAEALQLAAEHGKVSLAIRNPLDKSRIDTDATVLSQGKLAKLGELLDPTVFASGNGDRLRNQNDNPGDSSEDSLFGQDSPFVSGGSASQKMSWLVSVIRGKETKEESFDVPND